MNQHLVSLPLNPIINLMTSISPLNVSSENKSVQLDMVNEKCCFLLSHFMRCVILYSNMTQFPEILIKYIAKFQLFNKNTFKQLLSGQTVLLNENVH